MILAASPASGEEFLPSWPSVAQLRCRAGGRREWRADSCRL